MKPNLMQLPMTVEERQSRITGKEIKCEFLKPASMV